VTSIPARLDCIYVAASARDARYTRICVASIRHFYPEVPITLLAGGPLEQGLSKELARHWDVRMADIRPGDWGWGLVKLEPLFGSAGERFLVLDSDTAFAGEVLGTWAESSAHFLVDDEGQSEADTRRLYYDWRKAAEIDPTARPPQFVFNSGQWFGTAGVLTRQDFAPLIDWRNMPPKLRHPDLFMPGDQGVLNYVLNQKAMMDGVSVDRRKIMHWPGNGMDFFAAENVAGRNAPPLVIHWAGMKQPRLGAMAGADILRLFEQYYYARMPFGPVLWRLQSARYTCSAMLYELSIRARLVANRLWPHADPTALSAHRALT